MGDAGKIGALLFLLLALAAIAPGCGSSGDSTTESESRIYPNVTGPTREFLVAGGDNYVQLFGQEGTPSERSAAYRVIRDWMRARAAADWAADCSYMSRSFKSNLVADGNGVSDGKVKNCPQALAYFGASASGDLRNTLTGPIVSLRVKGSYAFAQYHGPEKDWVVPVEKEGGEWKVATATPLDRNK